MRRGTAATAAAITVALALAACGDGGGGGGGGAKGEQATIKVQDTAGVPAAFLQYGVEQGYFKSRKLDVKVQPSQGGATVIPSVVSGDTDIGGSNLVSVLLAQSKKVPVKIVAPGTFVRDKPAQDFSGIVVGKDSPVRSPKDLEGKTLAVNTLKNVCELTIKASLEKEGVDVDKLKFSEIPFPDMNGALEAKRVDAACEVEPFVSQAKAAGSTGIDPFYVNTAPDLSVATYFTSKQYAQQNPEVLKRFAKAMNKSLDYTQKNPDAARKVLSEYTEIPPQAIAKIRLPIWSSKLDRGSIELQAELAEKYGLVESKPNVDELIKEPGS